MESAQLYLCEHVTIINALEYTLIMLSILERQT
jgi:hypothetical protein